MHFFQSSAVTLAIAAFTISSTFFKDWFELEFFSSLHSLSVPISIQLDLTGSGRVEALKFHGHGHGLFHQLCIFLCLYFALLNVKVLLLSQLGHA